MGSAAGMSAAAVARTLPTVEGLVEPRKRAMIPLGASTTTSMNAPPSHRVGWDNTRASHAGSPDSAAAVPRLASRWSRYDVQGRAADRTPPGGRAAKHHHDEEGEREVRRGHVRRCAPHGEDVHDSPARGQPCGEDERAELVPRGVDAEHAGSKLVVANGDEGVAGSARGEPPQQYGHQYQIGQCEPVEVDRVAHAHERLGQPPGVQRQAVAPTGQAGRVAAHRHGTGLGEGERHHREGDPTGTQGHPA